MEAGGWKSPAMLKRYVHLGPSTVWQAVERRAEAGTGVKSGIVRMCNERRPSRARQPLDFKWWPPAPDEPVARLEGHWRGPVQPFGEADHQ
jgi:hypothetical protein